MNGTADQTRRNLTRRMAVARARLPDHQFTTGEHAIATDAAILAVRHAAAILPRSDAFHAEHIDVTFTEDACTVTVQAHTRADPGPAARLAAAAALAAIAAPGEVVTDATIVQVVED